MEYHAQGWRKPLSHDYNSPIGTLFRNKKKREKSRSSNGVAYHHSLDACNKRCVIEVYVTIFEVSLINYHSEINSNHCKTEIELFKIRCFWVDINFIDVWAISYNVFDPIFRHFEVGLSSKMNVHPNGDNNCICDGKGIKDQLPHLHIPNLEVKHEVIFVKHKAL